MGNLVNNSITGCCFIHFKFIFDNEFKTSHMLKFTLNGAVGGSEPSEQGALPSGGHVSRLRANWTVHEDGALAQRLQSEEINQHYHGNRQRNHQIREDLPQAREEQVREIQQACRVAEERRRALHEIESQDAEIARHVQTHFYQNTQNVAGSGTPPLPVMANGDVPEEDDDSPRQIVYNDEQYQVKLARPALIKDEPVYANNKPEHYAVSQKYPGGAIAKVPAASPRRRAFMNSSSENEENVVSLAGLSQKTSFYQEELRNKLNRKNMTKNWPEGCNTRWIS